jgi:hypothetical protein
MNEAAPWYFGLDGRRLSRETKELQLVAEGINGYWHTGFPGGWFRARHLAGADWPW